jgi:hypothetical protein
MQLTTENQSYNVWKWYSISIKGYRFVCRNLHDGLAFGYGVHRQGDRPLSG